MKCILIILSLIKMSVTTLDIIRTIVSNPNISVEEFEKLVLNCTDINSDINSNDFDCKKGYDFQYHLAHVLVEITGDIISEEKRDELILYLIELKYSHNISLDLNKDCMYSPLFWYAINFNEETNLDHEVGFVKTDLFYKIINDKDVDVNLGNGDDRYLLLDAVRSDDFEVVNILISRDDFDINLEDQSEHYTALIFACNNGDPNLKMLQLILDQDGVDGFHFSNEGTAFSKFYNNSEDGWYEDFRRTKRYIPENMIEGVEMLISKFGFNELVQNETRERDESFDVQMIRGGNSLLYKYFIDKGYLQRPDESDVVDFLNNKNHNWNEVMYMLRFIKTFIDFDKIGIDWYYFAQHCYFLEYLEFVDIYKVINGDTILTYILTVYEYREYNRYTPYDKNRIFKYLFEKYVFNVHECIDKYRKSAYQMAIDTENKKIIDIFKKYAKTEKARVMVHACKTKTNIKNLLDYNAFDYLMYFAHHATIRNGFDEITKPVADLTINWWNDITDDEKEIEIDED